MFSFKKEPLKSDVEIFNGITSSIISDIHAYLNETFGIVAEEQLNGDSTEFNIDNISSDRIDEAVQEIQRIVGEKFDVAGVAASNEKGDTQTIIITKK